MLATSSNEGISTLIDQLRERGIRLHLEGDRLRLNAPKGAVDDELKATIAERRSEIIEALKSSAAEEFSTGGIVRVSRDEPLPLSLAQLSFWFLEQMEPGRSDYNVGGGVRFYGPLDLEMLKKAVNQLVLRHETLRMRIHERNGNPEIEILRSSEAAIEVIDLSTSSIECREDEASRLANDWLCKSFDLERGPLARFLIVRLNADDHMLLISMHHAASDGWSWMIALREISELYTANLRGGVADLPALSIQYADYAAWERKQRTPSRLASHLAYWKQQLQGAPALLELPADRPRPAVKSHRGASMRRYFDKRLINSLNARAREHDVTPFMVLLAAWQMLLHRYSGQDDIVIGAPFANREIPALEGVIGDLVDILILRSQLGSNPTFVDFLAVVKQTTLSAFEHRDVSIDMLVEALNPSRSASHEPIFQTLFTFMSFSVELAAPDGLSVEMIQADRNSSRFDLTVELGFGIGEHKDKLCVLYEYATDLFDERTVSRMHAYFEQVLEAVAADPSFRIREFPLAISSDEQRLLNGWNATELDYDRTRCLHHLLEATAQAAPDMTAVAAGNTTLSYRELDQRSNRLAHLLVAHGVVAGDLVAICVDRTVDMPVAMAAVLKAGAAYVPLDPTHPAERLHYTLEDARVACAVTLTRFAPLLEGTKTKLLLLDDAQAALAAQPNTAPQVAVRPDNLAYVIYTSGSTGRPKGVGIEHRNVVNFLESMRREPGMVATDVLLAVTTLSFDIAGLEVWLPLSVGARLVIASRADVLDGERLISLVEKHGVTMLQATPATWLLMLEAGWNGKQDLKALCGGEAIRRELAVALLGRVAELWNMYGPTETTIWSTVSRILEPSNSIPIGHPIANTQIYVLDGAGRSVPIGMTGELCIGGEGVARGYWNWPELTAEKFIEIALPDGRAERVYRTGDVARLRWDGQLEFFGRRDHQVKVRGYRIELGEIEAVLSGYPGVKECAVIVHEDAPDNHSLASFVSLLEGASFDVEDARAALRLQLPEYMIPNTFSVLANLPLTLNGKIDRKALPRPAAPAMRADDPVEIFMTPLQTKIAGIWRDLLRRERVGLQDNFFDVGGHSLLLAKLHARLKHEFGSNLSMIELFQRTTIAAQADWFSTAVNTAGVSKQTQTPAI